MSYKGKDALSYRFVGLRRYDNDMDKIKLQNQRLKERIRKLESLYGTVEEFLTLGPHGQVWAAFRKKE